MLTKADLVSCVRINIEVIRLTSWYYSRIYLTSVRVGGNLTKIQTGYLACNLEHYCYVNLLSHDTYPQLLIFPLKLKRLSYVTLSDDVYSMHISCFNWCTLLRLDLPSWGCLSSEISSFSPFVIKFSSSLCFLFKSWNKPENMYLSFGHSKVISTATHTTAVYYYSAT